MKIELHEMLTILVFADQMPVASIVNEGKKWAVMFTNEMPLHMTPFEDRETALAYIYKRLENGTSMPSVVQTLEARAGG